jgi:ornithine carbamoyltransferase
VYNLLRNHVEQLAEHAGVPVYYGLNDGWHATQMPTSSRWARRVASPPSCSGRELQRTQLQDVQPGQIA